MRERECDGEEMRETERERENEKENEKNKNKNERRKEGKKEIERKRKRKKKKKKKRKRKRKRKFMSTVSEADHDLPDLTRPRLYFALAILAQAISRETLIPTQHHQ